MSLLKITAGQRTISGQNGDLTGRVRILSLMNTPILVHLNSPRVPIVFLHRERAKLDAKDLSTRD